MRLYIAKSWQVSSGVIIWLFKEQSVHKVPVVLIDPEVVVYKVSPAEL